MEISLTQLTGISGHNCDTAQRNSNLTKDNTILENCTERDTFAKAGRISAHVTLMGSAGPSLTAPCQISKLYEAFSNKNHPQNHHKWMVMKIAVFKYVIPN